ncbi:MAG: class I SAM-dependent methyltransferase [Acidimicrobiales bacterium]
MSRWLDRSDVPRGAEYDQRWTQMAAAGQHVHGEADLVTAYGERLVSVVAPSGRPVAVLDAGCGTGRVSIELSRRGFAVTGVDIDPAMLAQARAKDPDGHWELADLATLDLQESTVDPSAPSRRLFEVICLPGNVMIFLAPGSEPVVLQRLAAHLAAGGVLIAGFQLGPTRLSLARYDELAAAAGLVFEDRFATWDRQPFQPGGDYAVSVHRAPDRS